MKLSISNAVAEEFFHTALCNGLATLRSHGIELDYNELEYQVAKKTLPSPTFEDILLCMLRAGCELRFTDTETGEYTRYIALNDVHENMKYAPDLAISQMANNQCGSLVADVILQVVAYKSVIFA